MSRRKNEKKQNPLRTCLTTIFTGLVVVFLFVLSAVTGIDFMSILGLSTPAATQAPVTTQVASAPGSVSPITVGLGFGAEKGFWQVYFTAPTGSSDRTTYVNGIDAPLARAIAGAQRTLDIAAFELNNEVITQAILDAHRRGVRVRIVADNEHTIEDSDSTMGRIVSAGIPVVYDERSAFMHNKFMIIDSSVVWTGSTNYTVNDIYRNNNNMLVLRSRRAVEAYQTEFDQMYTSDLFGPRKNPNSVQFQQDGTPIQIMFAPESDVVSAVISEIRGADSHIRFMAFSFTLDPLGAALVQEAANGVTVEGIFELRGSQTQFSEMSLLFCAGADVRQDGNPYTMHHKVFIIDDHTVVTGSFNFSDNATNNNDENLIIIRDPDLAALYIAEFERVQAQGRRPDSVVCR